MVSVAIDGPAGAGKSTLARRLAAEMGYIYVDTGAMYRAIGLYALRAGKDPKDNAAVNALLPQIELRLASIEGEQHIYLKEEDVSTAIRTEAAGMAASAVGANPAVRAFLLELQRDMAKKQDVLMDGRDIGTVVLPDATVKIFLTATPEARATRRWKEYQARRLAAEMGYIYVDTGAMYRAIGLYALRAGKDPKDNAAVNALLPQIELRLASIEGEQHIYLKEEDVSTAIRTEAAGMAASAVGANPAVRAFLLELQRDMAKKQDVLMDGRDIGTVVLPDATVKIFLTATPEARATRRWKEYQAKGIDTPYEEVLADVKQRDYQDTHRAAAPLKQADDAVLLDTSELDFEQSLAAMKKIIAEKVNKTIK